MSYSEERIKNNKEFLTKAWNLKNDRPGIKMISNPLPFKYSWLEMFHSPKKNLEYQLKMIEDLSNIMDDTVPTLDTFLGTAVFPSAFGCEIHYYENIDPWAKPLIFDNPDDVYKLSDAPVDGGDLKKVLDTTAYFEEKTSGNYPIKITDPQSPLDIAYLIWKEEEFMMAMISNPKEVHKIMEKCTDLFIRFMKKQKSLCTEFSPVHAPNIWAPSELGISMSDDVCAILSPDMYEEFALPYMNMISEEFGGIFLHSCGDISHNLDNISKIKNLRCVNFAVTETPAEGVFEKFSGKTAIAAATGLNKDNLAVDSIIDFVEQVLKYKKTNEGLIVYAYRETPVPYKIPTTPDMINQAIQMIHDA
jgi:uroporphyrinogen-III decarboxylase